MKIRKVTIFAMIETVLIPIGVIFDKLWLIIISATVFLLLIPIAIWGDRWLESVINWIRGRTNKKYEWLFNLESQQRTGLSDYLYHHIDSINFSKFIDTRRITVDIEFFNMSVFTILLKKVKIFSKCNAQDIGEETIDIDKTQMWGRRDIYQIPLTITSQKACDAIIEAADQNSKIFLEFSLDWNIEATYLKMLFRHQRHIRYEAIPRIPKL